jgi:RNA polymerase sigma-70 factor (ECF subfamily)
MVRSSNGSAVLDSGERTVRVFLMTGEPESTPAAQETVSLFDELQAPLRRYLLFLGLPQEDADDVVQDAFLRLHRHLAARGDRSNLRGWIFQVARNLAHDKRKQAWYRFGKRDSGEALLAAVRDPSDSPEDRLIKLERTRELRAAIETLTPQQTECLRLRVAGLRYRQIADVMGIGISAVGELVQRATARLQEGLHGH